MTPEVRAVVKEGGFRRAMVEQVAELIPADDIHLDRWIEEAVAENESILSHAIVFAALIRNRPVDARHLVGLAKLSGGGYLAVFALHFRGEVPEFLLEGMRGTAVYRDTQASALLAIAEWCDIHRAGVYPTDLMAQARELARRVKAELRVDATLLDLSVRTKDSILERLIRDHYGKVTNAAGWTKIIAEARKIGQQTIDWAAGPALNVLPEEPLTLGKTGGTVRRAVERIGRNDPCHCGSGKKYKHCHYDQDRERLQRSSDVAGLTREELAAEPEPHLTLQRLEKKSVAEILAMDPAAIPRHLLGYYFFQLALSDIDQAALRLEKLGYEDDLEDAWFVTMFSAARTGRKDIGDRLMAIRRPFGLKEEDLRLSQRLLLARDEPGKWLRLVEEASLKALKSEDPEDLLDMGFSVVHTDQPALGLLLYRAALAFIPPNKGQSAYEIVLQFRERLNLPTQDPLKDFLDNRSIDADLALQEAEAKFEAKRREVRALRESLEQAEKDLARHQNEPQPQAAVPAAAPADGAVVLELRSKVKRLESDLKLKHNESNEMRRHLEKMQDRVEELAASAQAVPAAGSAVAEADHEEELLLEQDAENNHPLRLIEFPRDFLSRLNEFPHHVARGAMAALGRLAGGEGSAFSGAKRLKSAPTVVRQRIGIDFRLLFRLLPDRIQVIDLIPRQDLERRIKTIK